MRGVLIAATDLFCLRSRPWGTFIISDFVHRVRFVFINDSVENVLARYEMLVLFYMCCINFSPGFNIS